MGSEATASIRSADKSAPVGIRTRVTALKGPHDWPGYTTGACLNIGKLTLFNLKLVIVNIILLGPSLG